MIIAIDGYEANVERRVGIGRFAYEMLRHMYEIVKRRTDGGEGLSFRIYLPSAPRTDMPPVTNWWQYRVIPVPKLWTFVGLPFALLRDRPRADVIFSPTHYIPRWTGITKVMAIMDLSYMHFPDLFRTRDLHQLREWTKYSVRHAAKIFTISEFSRNAIMETYRVPAQRILVTYPGLTMDKLQKRLTKGALQKKYGLSARYILSVGTLQPRKNFEKLIEAFALLGGNVKDTSLVIIGKKGWLYDEILAAPKKYGVEDRVQFLDFVPDEDLPSFYSEADCFVLPSLYEGFGLPVLEAMAYRCPVVVSKSSSLPEIAGDAGIYVDPDSAASIEQGLEKALRERTLASGKNRMEEGVRQVAKFTWEKAAREALEALVTVGGGKS